MGGLPSNVWQTRDNGETWVRVYDNPPEIKCIGINDMAIHGSTVWLATGSGVLIRISRDTLQATEIPVTSGAVKTLMISDSGRLYISTADGILVSDNGGASFSTFAAITWALDLLEVDDSIYCVANGQVIDLGTDGTTRWSLDPTPSQAYGFLAAHDGVVYALSASTSGNSLARIEPRNGHGVTVTDLAGSNNRRGLACRHGRGHVHRSVRESPDFS